MELNHIPHDLESWDEAQDHFPGATEEEPVWIEMSEGITFYNERPEDENPNEPSQKVTSYEEMEYYIYPWYHEGEPHPDAPIT